MLAGEWVENFSRKHPSFRNRLKKSPRLAAVARRLEREGFSGVFKKYLEGARPSAVLRFLSECRRLDWKHLVRHRQALLQPAARHFGPGEVEPVRSVSLEHDGEASIRYRDAGREGLCRGWFAAVAFAGGAGTRFTSQLEELKSALARPNLELSAGGFTKDAPKGAFPISPVAGLSFYQLALGQALVAAASVGRLPWVLFLTSSTTDRQTRAHLGRCRSWGFPAAGWLTFRQARVPRLDGEGDLIVEDEEGRISQTGDGHGGIYRALFRSRRRGRPLVELLRAEGVRHLVMHNIDNAGARPFWEERLGFHLLEDALFTLSVVRKTDPAEKVGLVVRAGDRIEVIEYNLLDDRLARARDDAGRLLFAAGNTNTSLVALGAIKAEIDPILYSGKLVASRRGPVGASSLEMLNQHLTRKLDAARIRVLEVRREDFFLPTKNVVGPDSVQTTTEALAEKGRKALQKCGAQVDPSALVDLHPCCDSAESLSALGVGPGWLMGETSRLYLCLTPGKASLPSFRGGLELEPEALLYLEATRPWGELRLGKARKLSIDSRKAPRVEIGAGTVIKKGVQVKITLAPGARLEIPPHSTISRDVALVVGPGRTVRLP